MTTDTSSKDQGKSKTKGLKDQALAIWFMLDLTQELVTCWVIEIPLIMAI